MGGNKREAVKITCEHQLVANAVETGEQIEQRIAPILQRYPLVGYIHALNLAECQDAYYFVPAELSAQCEAIRSEFGVESLEDYHKLLLTTLISTIPSRLESLQLSAVHRQEVIDFLNIILREIKAGKRNYFLHGKDRFAKSLAVCRLKMLPCGPILADIKFGAISLRSLLTASIVDTLKRLRYVLFKTGSPVDFIELHMEFRLMRKLSPEGMEHAYRLIAKLIEADLTRKGLIVTGAWLFDPELQRISPELSYLRALPVDNGAIVFPAKTPESSVQDAISLSPHRKSLYESGDYVPQNYMLLWHRSDLLRWARAGRDAPGVQPGFTQASSPNKNQ